MVGKEVTCLFQESAVYYRGEVHLLLSPHSSRQVSYIQLLCAQLSIRGGHIKIQLFNNLEHYVTDEDTAVFFLMVK